MTSAAPVVPTAPAARTAPRFAAVDGIRGFFVLLFVLGHLGLTVLEGAWIAMDAFFVFSGFFMMSLLLRQKRRYGVVVPLEFYVNRARRILPGLVAMLLAVLAYAAVFLDPAERKVLGGDVQATLGFFMNWRLISQADEYFGNFETASFLRHAWSLSVEEQFYVLMPLAAMIIFAFRNRRLAVAALVTLTLYFSWRTSQIGVDTLEDQARSYYGTDARAQALVIGVTTALLLADGRIVKHPSARWAGWVGTLGVCVMMAFTSAMSPFMFEHGGLLLVGISSAIGVIGMHGPQDTSYVKVTSWRPMAWVGERVYGVYLWHWPIKLVIDRHLPDAPVAVDLVLGTTLTLVLAGISYRWLEKPVHDHGLRGLVPSVGAGRLLAVGAIAVVLVWSSVLRSTDAPDFVTRPLMPGTPDYVAGATSHTVGIMGDSVSVGLVENLPPNTYTDLEIVKLGANGCDLTSWTPTYVNLGPIEELPGCVESKRDLEKNVAANDVKTVVMIGPSMSSLPHWDPQGALYEANDPEHTSRVLASLDDLYAKAMRGGAERFFLTTVPCRGLEGSEDIPEDKQRYIDEYPEQAKKFGDPVELNAMLREWAADHEVEVIDHYAAMGCADGYRARINGVNVYKDRLHYTREGAAMVWTWLAPVIRERIEEGRR